MPSPKFFDCCLNLTHPSFDKDRADVLFRAYKQGITGSLVCSADERDSRTVLDMARNFNSQKEDFPLLYNTAGVHPHQAKTFHAKTVQILRDIAQEEECVAIGECGLDYARNYSVPAKQKEAFAAQLELAVELQLPVFLHQREAHQDFMEILKPYASRVPSLLVHCFTAGRQELEDYLELDAYIGITGWFCDERRGGHLHNLVGMIPSDRLILETDAPYLMPRNLSGNRNEPANLPVIAQAISNTLENSLQEVACSVYTNTLRFLKIQTDG